MIFVNVYIRTGVFFLIYILVWQALVDAPDMVRGQMNFKRLTLTDITIDIPRVPKKKTLIEAMEKAGKNDNLPTLWCFLKL